MVGLGFLFRKLLKALIIRGQPSRLKHWGNAHQVHLTTCKDPRSLSSDFKYKLFKDSNLRAVHIRFTSHHGRSKFFMRVLPPAPRDWETYFSKFKCWGKPLRDSIKRSWFKTIQIIQEYLLQIVEIEGIMFQSEK